MLSVKGTFENGAAHPVPLIQGHDGQAAIIFVNNNMIEAASSEYEAAWDRLEQLIEDCAIDAGISDLAHQHDHYLYGKPKQE